MFLWFSSTRTPQWNVYRRYHNKIISQNTHEVDYPFEFKFVLRKPHSDSDFLNASNLCRGKHESALNLHWFTLHYNIEFFIAIYMDRVLAIFYVSYIFYCLIQYDPRMITFFKNYNLMYQIVFSNYRRSKVLFTDSINFCKYVT